MSQAFDPKSLWNPTRQQAERLLADLLRQQSQLADPSAKLDAGARAQGHAALQEAIDAARRLIETLARAMPPESGSNQS